MPQEKKPEKMPASPPRSPQRRRKDPQIPARELIEQSNEARYTPATDGVDHINIHFWAQTPLGKLLATETECRFVHPDFGPFKSIEGFYFWVSHIGVPDVVRDAFGTKINKRFGAFKQRRLSNLKELLFSAHIAKISQHPHLAKLLRDCTLPFVSYYVNTSGLVIEIYKRQYLIDFLDSYRNHLRSGGTSENFQYEKRKKSSI